MYFMVVNKSSKLLIMCVCVCIYIYIYIYIYSICYETYPSFITHKTWSSLVTTELGPEASHVTVEFKVYYPASKSHWPLPTYC